MVVTGSLDTVPVTYADSTLTFSLTLSTDPCVLTRILDQDFADIHYMIDSKSSPSELTWTDFQFVEGDSDTLSSQACGDTLYDWPDQYEASPPISDYFTF